MQTGVEANQLPLRESFRDFDGLRKGVCTVQQAQAVLLSVLRLPLGEVRCPLTWGTSLNKLIYVNAAEGAHESTLSTDTSEKFKR